MISDETKQINEYFITTTGNIKSDAIVSGELLVSSFFAKTNQKITVQEVETFVQDGKWHVINKLKGNDLDFLKTEPNIETKTTTVTSTLYATLIYMLTVSVTSVFTLGIYLSCFSEYAGIKNLFPI